MSPKLYQLLVILFLISGSLISCQFLVSENDKPAIAKVNNAFLYKEDLQKFNIPEGLSEKDSIAVLMNYINDWATKQLILQESLKNMTQKQQLEYNNLVEQYRLDLFSSTYENALVEKNLNVKVTPDEVEDYFRNNKESFTLQNDLIQIRYIQYPNNYKNINATTKAFKRFNEVDISELEKLEPSYTNSDFNLDNNWTDLEIFLEKFPDLKRIKRTEWLVPSNFINFKTSDSQYLIFIEAVAKAGNIAPVTYVEEKIKQIILNQRKIQLKKKLEKEIRQDAIHNKEFQIFE